MQNKNMQHPIRRRTPSQTSGAMPAVKSAIRRPPVPSHRFEEEEWEEEQIQTPPRQHPMTRSAPRPQRAMVPAAPPQRVVYDADPLPAPRYASEKKRGMSRRGFFGLTAGVSVVGLGAVLGNQFLQAKEMDWTYGYPRTYHITAVVGMNDSTASPSHFIVVNLHGHIVLFHLPGGDISKSKVYSLGMISGDNADQVPVTISFGGDVNHPDLYVHANGQTTMFLNKDGGFVANANFNVNQ